MRNQKDFDVIVDFCGVHRNIFESEVSFQFHDEGPIFGSMLPRPHQWIGCFAEYWQAGHDPDDGPRGHDASDGARDVVFEQPLPFRREEWQSEFRVEQTDRDAEINFVTPERAGGLPFDAIEARGVL